MTGIKGWYLKTFWVLALLGFLAGPVVSQDSVETELPIRIIGGVEVRYEDFPWQVAILQINHDQGYQTCGGSIISDRWVLTAAHCVWDEQRNRQIPRENLAIYWGSESLESGGNIEFISRVIVHEGFDFKFMGADIALIELESSISAPSVPLALSRTPHLEVPGQVATVSGWGLVRPIYEYEEGHFVDLLTEHEVLREEISKYSPANLMAAGIRIVSLQECRSAMGDLASSVTERTICAGWPDGGRDSCSGDSGGPLHVRGDDSEFIQIGIVSWGRGACGLPGEYSVYTRVSSYWDWISQHVGLTAPAPPITETEPSPEPAGSPGANRALIVAIEDYATPSFDLIGGSVNDAANMQQFLLDEWGFAPEEIRVLSNQEATKDAILAEFQSFLIDGSEPGGHVVFYYSGHGYYIQDENGDESDGFDEAIAPYDVRILDFETRPVESRNLVIDDELAPLIAALQNRRVSIIIDSCHSGTISRSIGAIGSSREARSLSLALNDPAVSIGNNTRSAIRSRDVGYIDRTDHAQLAVWSAVSPTQLALINTEDPDDLGGVFTKAWIAGARGTADLNEDSFVTHSELHSYVLSESESYCQRHPENCQAGLTPILETPQGILNRDIITFQEIDAGALPDQVGAIEISVEVLPSSELTEGETARFRVGVDRDGFLILLDYNTAGELTQLYPNQFARSEDNAVRAGEYITVPDASYGFEFEAGPPFGRGQIVAVVTDDQIDFSDVLEENADFGAVEDSEDYEERLTKALQEPIVSVGQDGQLVVTAPHWSLTRTNYEIRGQ